MKAIIVFGVGALAGAMAAAVGFNRYATADVRGVECPCPGDADCNGLVNFADITKVLENWGNNCIPDADMDGWTALDDCNDNNASVFPGAPEFCNNIDDDCDGIIDDGVVGGQPWFRDLDGDGFGNPSQSLFACSQPMGYVANPIDCDDTNSSVRPGAPELCNGIDDNCNAIVDDNPIGAPAWFPDADHDGWGAFTAPIFTCNPPAGFVDQSGDCNDQNSSINPGVPEGCFDNIDNNCDGRVDEDCGEPIP